MIQSQFIRDIFQLSIHEDAYGDKFRHQVACLTESEYEYTGSGVFIFFKQDPEIAKWTISEDEVMDILEHAEESQLFCIMEIENKKDRIEAEPIIRMKEGLIDSIEIWNRRGDYPRRELEFYEMYRLSDKEKKKTITRVNK
jgi:hypothetical protein